VKRPNGWFQLRSDCFQLHLGNQRRSWATKNTKTRRHEEDNPILLRVFVIFVIFVVIDAASYPDAAESSRVRVLE